MALIRAFKNLKSMKSIHTYIIIFIGIVSTIPLIFCRNYYADDIAAHITFAKYFAEQFWLGDFYPRWLFKDGAVA